MSQTSMIMLACNLNLVRCWTMKQWKILFIYCFFATSLNIAILFLGILWAALSYWQRLAVNFYSHICSHVPFLLTLAGACEWFLLSGVPWGLHWECPSLYIWDFLSHPSVHQHWVRECLHSSVQKISHGGQFQKHSVVKENPHWHLICLVFFLVLELWCDVLELYFRV